MLLSAAACEPPFKYEWGLGFDINDDGEISRAEWHLIYRETDVRSLSVMDFENFDCNHDGRLNEDELYDGRILVKTCPDRGLLDRPEPDERRDAYAYPLLLTEQELNLINQSSSSALLEILTPVLSDVPGTVSEQFLPMTGNLIYAECGQMRAVDIRRSSNDLPSGMHWGRECIVQNNSNEFSITAVVARIQVDSSEGRDVSRHVKPLYVAPGVAQVILVLFPSQDVEVDVAFLEARRQR